MREFLIPTDHESYDAAITEIHLFRSGSPNLSFSIRSVLIGKEEKLCSHVSLIPKSERAGARLGRFVTRCTAARPFLVPVGQSVVTGTNR